MCSAMKELNAGGDWLENNVDPLEKSSAPDRRRTLGERLKAVRGLVAEAQITVASAGE